MSGSGRSFLPLLAAALLVLLATGCGYRTLSGSSEEAAPARARRADVAVIALRNDSPEPWLDRVVTDALRRELSLRGALRLTSDPERADPVSSVVST